MSKSFDWSKGLDQMFKERRKINNMLSPSKDQINLLVNYSRGIFGHVDRIQTFSDMAHQEIISFNMAQELIDIQMESLKLCVESVHDFLKEDNGK